MADKKTVKEVAQEKANRVMEGVAYWAAFYRKNPQRFAKDYLNIQLKLFQKILIFAMVISTNFMYIASRGQGKTWLLALYCVIRCILFPGTKIVVASGVKSQAIEVLNKIQDDFMKMHEWGSANLRNEISFISTSVNNPVCDFKNGSYIHAVASNDNARSNRANIILLDEFRLIDPVTINTVLRKFLTAPREPGYLSNPKYKHLAERNCELYATSAWYKSHWSFEKTKAYFANMLDDAKKYFVVGLNYCIAIKEGLLMRSQIEDEMSEEDFDPISFEMEMGALFHGDSGQAFFKHENLSKCRKIKNSLLRLDMYDKRGINVPELAAGERRFLTVDIALMASKKNKNDATAIGIDQAIPDGTHYKENLTYLQTFEGKTTDEIGITIMRYFYKYKCTDLVLDANGVGIGVFDFICREQFDPETGETYTALTSCNNQEMAERCKDKRANKVVWCIKADAKFNNNAAVSLRSAIDNGRVNLLVSETDAVEIVKKLPGYKSFTPDEQAKLLMPYVQTSMLINEMVNLEHEIVDGKIKLKEQSGMRKDRFSAFEYVHAIVSELSTNLRSKTVEQDILDLLTIRPAKRSARF